MPLIETQIKIAIVIFVLEILFICFQSIRIGMFVKARFGKVEALGWIVLLLYRLYGFWGLSENIERAKYAGFIKESFTLDQWVNIGGNLIFLAIIIASKHMERRAIKKSWGF